MGVLDRILVTPSNHRVHHAQTARYINKNSGGILILWDRIFGTFEPERDDDPVVFGVRKPLANWNPFWANIQVYDYLLFDSLHAISWRDKIGVWFGRTGWRPADVEAQYPKQRSELRSFKKFDPGVGRGRRYYVLAQFAFTIAGALYIADMFAKDGALPVLLPCLLLWIQLYTLGILGEGRSHAQNVEYVRLFLVVPAGVYALQFTSAGIQLPQAGWVFLINYILASALWLKRR